MPALMPGNVDKTRSAPAVAIIAWDVEFYERLPHLFPFGDFKSYFVGNQPLIEETGFRNSSLQGAYFILAAGSRPRLRTDVGVRRLEGQRRVLSRWQVEG